MSAKSGTLEQLIEAGYNAGDLARFESWRQRVLAFLSQSFEPQVFLDFQNLWMQKGDEGWEIKKSALLGMLEGLLAKTVDQDSPMELSRSGLVSSTRTQPTLSSSLQSKKVFIVHGHDEAAKESVARFLEKLKLEPIILHEQPNSGRTLIEKFEVYADVGFAVVLLTPDDVGSPASEARAGSMKHRARQNVILELGYSGCGNVQHPHSFRQAQGRL